MSVCADCKYSAKDREALVCFLTPNSPVELWNNFQECRQFAERPPGEEALSAEQYEQKLISAAEKQNRPQGQEGKAQGGE